ncbi:MAG TPA: hypothetical protein VF098_12690 [Sphingomicrobium sp.]
MITSLIALAGSSMALAQPLLQPMATLVDHCWAGPAPGGNGAIDKHCFESVYGGQHVRDRHVITVGGKDVYAGESLYSARGSQVIFTYWNSLGGLGTGTASFTSVEWRFSGTIHATPAGGEQPIAATWKIVPGGYEVSDGSGPPRLFKQAN